MQKPVNMRRTFGGCVTVGLPRAAKHAAAIVWCAFTFIQCSDHYGLASGTWKGERPKATYQGAAKINGKKPGKRFRLPYASGIVGNDKAFIKVPGSPG